MSANSDSGMKKFFKKGPFVIIQVE